MENDEENKPGRFKSAGLLFLIGTLLGFLYSVGVLFVTPKKYESTSIIQFRPPPEAAGQFDERAIATEAAILASPETMKEVAQSLELPREWEMDRDDVVTSLTSIVEVEPNDEGDLFEVTVIHPNPATARSIAKEVPIAYARRKKGEQRRVAEQELKELAKTILEQQDLIDESRDHLRMVVRESGHPNVKKEPMTRKDYLAFINGLSKDDRATKKVDLSLFEKAREDLDEKEETLELLAQKRIETKLKTSRLYEPIIIHGEAKHPRLAVFPNVSLGLLWGLGKGVVFGLVLVLSAVLFKRASKDKSESPEPREERPSDPADVW